MPHDADWTYSLIFPPVHRWSAFRATASYRQIHEWLRAAFARLDVATELSSDGRKDRPGQCFASAEQFDLLWHERKIAGAAQRRNRQGLLIQGSVQPPPIGLARADWQKAMCDLAFEEWNVDWLPFEPDTALNQRVESLVRMKYSLAEYNQRC